MATIEMLLATGIVETVSEDEDIVYVRLTTGWEITGEHSFNAPTLQAAHDKLTEACACACHECRAERNIWAADARYDLEVG